MKDFLTIKEFSELSGIENSTLRYWDEIGLFLPAKRDADTGYRYYTPEQVITVNFITVLSNMGIPLKTLGEIAEKRTPERVAGLIEERERQLDSEIRRMCNRRAVMRTRLDLIKVGMSIEDVNEISVRSLKDAYYIKGRRNEFVEGEKFYRPFMQFCREAKDLRVDLELPVAGLHDDWAGFLGAPNEPHYYISVDPVGNYMRPAGDYVVGFARGYYGEMGDLPERMRRYISENGLEVTGPVFTIFLHDEICIRNPSELLAYACVRVANSAKHSTV